MADREVPLFVAPGTAPGGLVVFILIGGKVWYDGVVPDLHEETLEARLTEWGAIGRHALTLSTGLDRALTLVMFDGDTGRRFAEVTGPPPPRWFNGGVIPQDRLG
jgi:hypothetical protein